MANIPKLGILAALSLIFGAVGFVGNVDFVITRSTDPGWMKDVAEFFISPPIWFTWFTEILFICGLLFAGYAIYISRRQPQPNAQSNVMHEESNLKHDIWLTDAAQYIASGSWSAPKITINNGEAVGKLYDAEKKIRQAAYDGDLPIWGMHNFSGPLKLIPKDYWARYGFEMMGILGNHEEWRTEHREGARDESIFHSLKTTKEKVGKLWPSGYTLL